MGEQRPFRFGVIASGNPSREQWIEQVCRAEALGYSTFSSGEHVFTGLASTPALASAAMITSTIRIGSLTFANDLHNPVMLARDVATLDVLSGGRFEFGLGSGYLSPDYAWTGIPLDPPGVRLSRLSEAVRLIKRAFTDTAVDFEGEHYSASGLALTPRPVQQPWPPMLIGGGGRRVLGFAAREADIVGIGLKATQDGGIGWDDLSEEAYMRKVGWVREAAGDRWPNVDLHAMVNPFSITDNPRRVAEKFLDGFKAPNTIQAENLLASPHTLVGSEDAIVEMLQERREIYSINYITVFSGAMDAFAPIIARLAGR